MNKREKLITMRDAARINLVVYTPDCPPGRIEGAVLMVHGFGEHAGRYEGLAERFCRRHYLFYVFDQRGHGKTPGRRGVASSYGAMQSDIGEMIGRIRDEYPGVPISLYGHSMGGNLVLHYLISQPCRGVVCAVVSSPWLQLYKPPRAALAAAAGAAAALLPGFAVKASLNLSYLTHDRQIVENLNKDPLYHNKIGARLYFQIDEAARYILENADKLKVKTLMLTAEDDRIISVQAAAQFCGKAGDRVTAITWPGAYHELHNEPNADEVFEAVRGFIRIYTRAFERDCGK